MKRLLTEILIVLLVGTGLAMAITPHMLKQKGLSKGSVVRLHFGVTGAFFCSGTVISPTRVLTAGHCAAAAVLEVPMFGTVTTPIIVKLADGTVVDANAYSLAADPRTDQGLVGGHFDSVAPQKVITDPASNIHIFETKRLISCGYPFGAKLFCTKVEFVGQHDFQFSGNSHLYPGMSGGPVFDADTGEIVGINSAVEGALSYFANTIEIFSNLHVDIIL